MGFLYDIVTDLFKVFKFYETVYEGEAGLYFFLGRAIKRQVKWGEDEKEKKELELIIDEERKIARSISGRVLLPKKAEELGVKTFQLYRHIGRAPYEVKERTLRPGLYLLCPIPGITWVKRIENKETVLNGGYVSFLTTDDDPTKRVILAGYNLNHQVIDPWKAFTQVGNFEASLNNYALTVLTKLGRGRSYSDWTDREKVAALEKEVLDELRKKATEDWGLKISKFTITDTVPHSLQRNIHEGSNPIQLKVGHEELVKLD